MTIQNAKILSGVVDGETVEVEDGAIIIRSGASVTNCRLKAPTILIETSSNKAGETSLEGNHIGPIDAFMFVTPHEQVAMPVVSVDRRDE